MLATDKKPVEILNQLISANSERLEGYGSAADETEVEILKVLFTRLTETSMVCRKELSDEVYKLGGQPFESVKNPCVVNAAWLDLKLALECNDHLTLLKSCEQEEAAVIELYKNTLTLEEENLTLMHRKLFLRHNDLLNADHSKVKNLLTVLLKAN
ncbi:MAG: PA2169 family four-helix-bundle protein [Bacteroidetes bacterium]|nr:PA2169 family four-helix-bundle protein [Bacteroidota bacterium]